MIHEPSKEADELHDIVKKQRDPIAECTAQAKVDLAVDLRKAQMFDELVNAMADYEDLVKSRFHSADIAVVRAKTELQKCFNRARALQKRDGESR